MSIKRVELAFEGQFTRIPNSWARDARLTRKARGLLVEIMSHRVGWKVTTKTLESAGREGREAILSALNELIEFGYLVRAQDRAESGKFTEVEYELADPTANGFSGNGQTVSGLSGNGKSAPKKTIDKEDHLEEDVAAAAALFEPPIDVVEADPFDVFWAVYPRHVGKVAARKAFLGQARKVDPQLIVDGARRFAGDPNLPEPQFIPYPTTWLNQGRWDDEPLPPRADAPVGDGPRSGPSRPLEAVPEWLGLLRIPYEEYLERKSEPGWVESMREMAARRAG